MIPWEHPMPPTPVSGKHFPTQRHSACHSRGPIARSAHSSPRGTCAPDPLNPTALFPAAAEGGPTRTPSYRHSCQQVVGSARGRLPGTGSTARGSPAATSSGRRAVLSRDTPADRAGGHAKQGPHPAAGWASTGEALAPPAGERLGGQGEGRRGHEGHEGHAQRCPQGAWARRGLTPGTAVSAPRPGLRLADEDGSSLRSTVARGWRGPGGLHAHSTCPAHGRPGPLQRAQALSSEGDVLLGRGQALGLEELPPVLVTEDRVHGLQEVLAVLGGAVEVTVLGRLSPTGTATVTGAPSKP